MEVQSSNQSPTTSAEETQESTVREIKNECEITWDRIQETHHRLTTRVENSREVGVDNDNAMLKILQHKERRLKAELEILKSQDIEVVSKHPKFIEALLRDNLKKSIEQLKETLIIVKGQRQEVAGEIQRETKSLAEQKEIQRALQEKIQNHQEHDVVQSQNSVLKDLQTRKKQANKHHLEVMKQLGTFLFQHFPQPKSDDVKSGQTNSAKRSDQYCSLKHLTEVLINRLFESPHDPYIKLLPTYWPPYIELLLRYGVIQRHPNDCNLIRVVAYHM